MVKCPSCGLLNPDNSQRCDCGYSFSLMPVSIKTQRNTDLEQGFVIKDIDMKFWSMVGFMVKWAFASIPAILIVAAIAWGIFLVFIALFGSIGGLIK